MASTRKRPKNWIPLSIVSFLLLTIMILMLTLFSPGCGGEENCAVEQENCLRSYLDANGLTGCCSGLTCRDSSISPGARICKSY